MFRRQRAIYVSMIGDMTTRPASTAQQGLLTWRAVVPSTCAGDPELEHFMLTTITVVGGDGLQNDIHAMDSMQQRAVASLCTVGQGKRHPRMEDGVREVVRPAVRAAHADARRTDRFNHFGSHPWVLLAVRHEPLSDRLCNLLGKHIAEEKESRMSDGTFMSVVMMLSSQPWTECTNVELITSDSRVWMRDWLHCGGAAVRERKHVASHSHKLEHWKSHLISGQHSVV